MTQKNRSRLDKGSHGQRSFQTYSHLQTETVPPLSKITPANQWIGTLTESYQADTKSQSEQLEDLAFKLQSEESMELNTFVFKSPFDREKGPLQKLMADILERPSGNVFCMGKLSAAETLTLILTNPAKLNQFINKVMLVMPQLSTVGARNCEMLVLLLRKITECDYQLIQSKEDLKLRFSEKAADSKKREIEQLQAKIQQKSNQLKEIVGYYEDNVEKLKQTVSGLIENDEGSEVSSPFSRDSPRFKTSRRKLGF